MTALAMAAPGFEVKKLHQRFLSILPRIKTHARIYFRDIVCRDQRADCIAEAVALAWKWFVRLAQRGKDATRFPSVLATFAAKAVRSGRRVTGQERAKDALSPIAQRRHGFTVSKLPDYSTVNSNPLEEALHDNTRTPPPDAAAFRLDFPVWLWSHGHRDRRMIVDMAVGERTFELACMHGISPGRVSQLRREFCDDWRKFCEE